MNSNSNRGKRRNSNLIADFGGNLSGSENDGVSFVFLLMGMVTTLLVSLLVYSSMSGSPVTERALAAAAMGDASEEVNAIESEIDFRNLVKDGNKAELINVLTGLNRSAIAEITIRENQRRVDVANQLLAMSLDPSERRLAVVSKLEGLSAIYEMSLLDDLDMPSVAGKLRDTAKLFLDESDDSIGRTAKICKFKVTALELAKNANPDVGKITNEMCGLLRAYPDDDEVISTVRWVVSYYRLYVDRAICQKITNKLKERKQEFSSRKSLRLIHEFGDEAMLLESKYAQLFENREIDGARGQRELVEKSIELAGEPDAGEKVIEEIDAVAHWFEQARLYDNESKIYEAFLNSVDNYKDPEVAAMARKKANDGLMRIDLQGKEIDLSGLQFDGSRISGSSFRGRHVVVLFWSVDDGKSFELLKSLYKKVPVWNQGGVTILAVNVDQDKHHQLKSMFVEMTNIDFVFGDANRNFSNDLLDQCPSSLTPRVMLVHKNGTVANINVELKEVATEVEFLLGK